MIYLKDFLYDFNGFNIILFHYINNLFANNSFFEFIIPILSAIGSWKTFPFIILALLLISLLKISYKHQLTFYQTFFNNEFKAYFNILVPICVAYIITICIAYILKNFLIFPRPLCILENLNIIKEIGYSSIDQMIYDRCNEDGSFPSAHSSIAAVLIIGLWKKLGNFGQILGILYLLIIGVTRIAIGVHFPADVIWGTILGASVMLLISYIFKNLSGIRNLLTFKL